jgi:heavy metal sensor kinase
VSLANRLSAFFLGMLALVLAGFSASLYLLACVYLYRQSDERLRGGLDILAACVEVEVDGLEWEPNLHHLTLGRGTSPEELRWEIRDTAGRLVDRSANRTTTDSEALGPLEAMDEPRTVRRAGGSWRLAQRTLRFTSPVAATAKTSSEADRPEPAVVRYPGLVLTTAVDLGPCQATLRSLALALAGLSLFLLLSVATLGRWLSRRALSPLTRMAGAARDMAAADLSQRLPDPGTSDELAALHGAFNGLLDRVQEAFERQRQFTGNASHQLRTPLTALLGQVELALRRPRPADEYRHTLALVHEQASDLRRIVEALLFLARADAEAELPGAEELDLTVWLQSHLTQWANHPRAADLRVEMATEAECLIQAPPVLLGQLYDNLLENALKYSPPATPVVVSLARSQSEVHLSVQNLGDGINPEELPHIFEPFYRSSAARRLGRPGEGLGLAVGHRIARAMGGTLEATSEPGHGCRLTLRLPALLTGCSGKPAGPSSLPSTAPPKADAGSA